ncbi:DUF1553 domain-containing protein [Catalinimonas sp. 4WD22]|uniref:DUF1553 domain-containing protein n=1 Tax=Catalinimonas locisalis TaxID=3133978 RepID=UPI00310189CC
MKNFFTYMFMLASVITLLEACGPQKTAFPPEIEAQLPQTIDFNYHIKPILSDRCFACHGPDKNKQEADLRLDIEESALAALGEEQDRHAIVPGNPAKSELFHRITAEDAEVVMPPPESNLKLSEYEIALLTRWIEEGAEYKPHWSFIPPKTPELPTLEQEDWVKNPIDHFVLARLEQENLSPSPEASKVQLLRRVSFDLNGLPPSPEETDAFLADTSVNAYEKVVDRLLASPRYGERMAMDWLDVARYADSHGYHADGYRMMWPWRDWVIKAFNENLPFDDFVTWQMAGDLLPDASQEQLLATGFHRNHPASSESGIVPEEYRLENVFDRTNTTAKALLGLTLECARCHDHKYDPISQKEYYQFSAFFNNVDELGMIANDGNTAPTMPLMQEEVAEKVAYIRKLIAEQEQKQENYQQKALNKLSGQAVKVAADFLQQGLIGHYPLDKITDEQTPNVSGTKHPASLRGEVEVVPGKEGSALRFDSEYEFLSLPEVGDFERTDAFSMGAWVYPEKKEDYTVILGNAGGKNSHWRGYELFLDSLNRVSVRLTHGLPDHCLYVTTEDSIHLNEWSHLMFTYDGSSKASGITIYVNGKSAPVQVQYDRLYKSIRTIDDTLKVEARAIRVGRSYRGALDIGLFEGAVDDIRLYNRQLTGLEVAGVTGNFFWKDTPYDKLGVEEQALLSEYYLHHKDQQYHQLRAQLQALRKEEHATLDTVPEVMVMREMDPPRKTYVLDRGMYDAPREEVQPGTLSDVLPFSEEFPPNRLGLSQWLLSAENPLTARVAVNRYWHMFFGRGIVGTLEDFGNQGDLPTHPELLDWLAVAFRESGWNVKALLRLIVTSSTYRQSSVAGQELRQKDPDNKLLARGPSHRLPAEMIRDNAMAASGLLVNKLGGPSVKTYQPEGLWSKTHFSRLLVNYEPDQGEKLYRRSMYTFIRRTAPPPSMTVLDASDRSTCIIRRQTTSTPLQALLLMNEPQMIEAARLIAERVIREGGESIDAQLNLAFRLLSSRKLRNDELPLMRELYEQEYRKYQHDQKGASALLEVGDYPRDTSLPLSRVAALTTVTNIMMNYDEVYTKR